MKKALVSGALGLAVLGAAAVPGHTAFATASQRQAQRCAQLVSVIQMLRTERAATTDPNVLAAINQAGQKVVNKASHLGCTIPPP